MPKPHDVELTKAKVTRLAKDAALCAAAVRLLGDNRISIPGYRQAMAAATRILKTLKLED